MIKLLTQKIGGREFLAFANGLVPVDQVKAVERNGEFVRVELLGDSRPYRDYRPAPGEK